METTKNVQVQEKQEEKNFVTEAKDIIANQIEKDNKGIPKITTSQLRKFLSAVNSVANKIQNIQTVELPADLKNEIQYLRVKLAYQAGRYKEVKELAVKAKLDEKIKTIKTKTDFVNFARFIEAIIAYHKFYGGKENGR